MVQDKKDISSFDIFHTGLIYWIAGGIVFWFVDLITIIIGIPYSPDFRKFIENGLPIISSINFTLSINDIITGYLAYLFFSLIVGIICSALVVIVAKNKNRFEIESIFSSVFLVFSFYIFSVVWINTLSPVFLSIKSIIANTLLLFTCGIFAYILYKKIESTSSETTFPCFLISTFLLDLFMMGLALIARILLMKLFAIKWVIYVIPLAAACLVIIFMFKYLIWRSIKINNIYSSGKYIIIIAGIITLISGYLLNKSEYSTVIGRGKDNTAIINPNILFIVMDTTRADHLSCYGYSRETSPYLDRIAGEGALFKKAISTSGWTLPAHISMFTGLYPYEHGVGFASPYLPEKIETITVIFKKNGYRTLGYSNNPFVSDLSGLSRKFDDFQVGWKKFEKRYFYKIASNMARDVLKVGGPGMKMMDDGAALTSRYVLEWMEKNSKSPFFIFINYMEPHLPYHPPAPFDSLFMPNNISPQERNIYSPDPKVARTLFEPRNRVPKELAVINALYDGEIRYLDEKIWMLYERLAKLNVLDNTVIIITSDHGDNLGDHNIVGHGYGLHNTLLEVPLIIRYPKLFPPGTIINDKVQTTDIYYTILGIVGEVGNPSVLKLGKSLATRINEKKFEEIMIAERDKSIWVEWAKSEGVQTDHLNNTQKTLISGNYKYIWSSNGEEELYDIVNDHEESTNIASKSIQIVNILKYEMEQISLKAKSGSQSPLPMPKMDDATKEQLKSLGYINK